MGLLRTPTGQLFVLGKLGGILGTLFFAQSFVLSTRARFLERLWPGMNRVYIAHHILGGVSLILLVVHVVGISSAYIPVSLERAFGMLLPSLDDLPLTYGILGFYLLVSLLILTFFVKLLYHRWLFTHKFLGLAFLLGALHVYFIPSDVSMNNPMRAYMLFWVLVGLVAFVYKTLLGKRLIKTYAYTVERVELLNDTVVELYLKPTGQKMQFHPGQFVFIQIDDPDLSKEAHPFSVSSSPDDDLLRLTIKELGDQTSLYRFVNIGTVVNVEGPFGTFTFSKYPNTHQVWIAGGIGVTPFISMVQSVTDESPYKAVLFYSVMTMKDAVYHAMLVEQDKVLRDFRYVPYISDQEEGYLTADKIEGMLGTLLGLDFFICGPPVMMLSLKKQLLQKGVPRSAIHTEEFSL